MFNVKFQNMTAEGNYEKLSNRQSNILTNLNNFRADTQFCDVLLQVENTTFPAHRNILSATSNYFFTMFTINMKEKYERRIKIEEMLADTMKIVLDFIYTGNIQITEKNVGTLLHAGSLMQISALLGTIEMYLSKNLNVQNCLMFYDLSSRYLLEKIKMEVVGFILENFEKIFQQKEFFDLSLEKLENFLRSDDLKVEEEKVVFEVVVEWVEKNLKERKKHFVKLFRTIRLQFLPFEYIVKTVRKNSLIKESLIARDLMEEVFIHHVQPAMVPRQTPRISYKPKPMHALVVYTAQKFQQTYDAVAKQFHHVEFDGWNTDLISNDCAVAVHPTMSLFCGGKKNGSSSNAVIQFDGVKWKSIASMNEARCGPAATFYKKKLYVFGGEKNPIDRDECYNDNEQNPRNLDDFVDSFEVFNTEWKIRGKLISSCSYASAQTLEDEIYLMGGYTANMQGGKTYSYQKVRCKIPSATTFIYNLKNGKWKYGPSMKSARAEFGSAVFNSTIYALGGNEFDGYSLAKIEFLKTSSDCKTWTDVTTKVPYYLAQSHACCIKNHLFVTIADYTVLLRFDIESEQWSVEDKKLPSNSGFIIPF